MSRRAARKPVAASPVEVPSLTDDQIRHIKDRNLALGLVEMPACERLREMAREVPADHAIVEIGAYAGRSTGWLALGSIEGHGARVHTVDTWDSRPLDTWDYNDYGYKGTIATYHEVEGVYQKHLDDCGIRSMVEVHKGWSTEVGKSWDGPPVAVWFHDGDHSFEAIRDDVAAWSEHLAPGAVAIFHDAGNPEVGVYQSCRMVLRDDPAWDWENRIYQPWRKPDRVLTKRGILIVRKHG